jgi:hypothetical protein
MSSSVTALRVLLDLSVCHVHAQACPPSPFRAKYRVGNRPEYEAGLKQRGDLTPLALQLHLSFAM